MPLFAAEINKAENWRALLPASSNLLVSLRKMPVAESALILHPLGVLSVSQRALPLELTLDRVGTQKPSDVNRLSLAVTGGGLSRKDDAFEQFAAAQFQDFSDAEKLSLPAFAPERSGVNLTSEGADIRSSLMIKRVVRYEEIIIDSNFKRFQRRFSGFFGTLFDFFLAGNSASRCELSQTNKRQLQPFAEKHRDPGGDLHGGVSVKQQTFCGRLSLVYERGECARLSESKSCCRRLARGADSRDSQF